MSELDKLKSMQRVNWSAKDGLSGVTAFGLDDSPSSKARSEDEEMLIIMRLMQAPKFREDLAALVDKTMHGFVQKIWRYLSAVAGVISILLTYIFLQTSANLTNLSASVVRLGNEISSLGAIVQSVEKQADKNQAKTERLEERIYSRGTR